MVKKVVRSFRDLEVYKKLVELHLEVSELTMKFPRHELFELGAQLRRSSNSAPANVAEGWNNKHTNIYLEGISRAMGEMQETLHHLCVAYRKHYLAGPAHESLVARYEECGRMLRGLESALERSNAKRPLHLSPIT